MSGEYQPISLRAYYGKVWEKATHLEDGKWSRRAVAEIVVSVLGMAIWGYFLGFDRTIEARTLAILFVGSGLILTGIARFVACLIRAPHQIYLEDQSLLFGTEIKLRSAISERDVALHAFDDDRYSFAAQIIKPLGTQEKLFLKALLERPLVAGQGPLWGLREAGIVSHEPSGGLCYLLPAYRPIVQRLLREDGVI